MINIEIVNRLASGSPVFTFLPCPAFSLPDFYQKVGWDASTKYLFHILIVRSVSIKYTDFFIVQEYGMSYYRSMTRRFAPIDSIIEITDSNRNSLMPRHGASGHATAYLKGHNGHYYLITPWQYGTPYIIRLYTKNQIRESNVLEIDLDRSEVLDCDGRLTMKAKRQFMMAVNDHKAFHHVPKVVDTQRQACYRWEAAFHHEMLETTGKHNGFTTIENCTKYVEIILQKEGITKIPTIRYTKKGSCSAAWGDWKLKFLVNSDNKIAVDTIIHELAHIIDSSRGRNRLAEAGHGPKFIGVYIDLLVRYTAGDREFLERTARNHGLKIDYDRAAA